MKRLLVLALLALSCGRKEHSVSESREPSYSGSLTIVAGSENESLQPILDRFSKQNNIELKMQYKGSVDTMLALQDRNQEFDAIWPANSIWIDLGDTQRRVKLAESIMRSPVVFAVKKSVARRLGWIGKEVTVGDILAAAEAGRIRYMMTSATQSNSGASAYLGYLYSFAGSPEVLTADHLKDPEVTGKIRRLLATVNRSAGSSGWLRDLFLQKFDQFDGMVNYESIVIETNRELERQQREPLYAIYPADGLSIADHPLAYVDRKQPEKEALFRKLQQYLLSPEIQQEIMKSGRRVGVAGAVELDGATFRADWGIDAARVLTPIRYPTADVLRQALTLYQTSFRKPSITVYCLDYSGSMRESGEDELKGAMRTLLDQPTAERYLLQMSARDITIVIPFNDRPIDQWSIAGNEPNIVGDLLARINRLDADGGTDIFSPVLRAREIIEKQPGLEGYFPAIILMSDGKSEDGLSIDTFRERWNTRSRDIPIYSITFGKAYDSEMKVLADVSSGRVFDGRSDLVRAFRQARGYN